MVVCDGPEIISFKYKNTQYMPKEFFETERYYRQYVWTLWNKIEKSYLKKSATPDY